MPGETGVGGERGVGDAAGDGGDLLAGGAFGRGGGGVVDVVDVAAGAVAHEADEGGFASVAGVGGGEARGEFAGEGGEVVGGNGDQIKMLNFIHEMGVLGEHIHKLFRIQTHWVSWSAFHKNHKFAFLN